MVALWNRADHYIFILWFLSSIYLLLSFLALSQWPHIGCLPSLECRSEMCCTRLAENTGHKKVAKNRHLGTIAQLCRAISSQLRHLSTIAKKLVNQQYVLQMSPRYGELGPLVAEIGPVVWGTTAYFNGFRVLATLLHGSPVVGVSQTLWR